MPKPDDNSKPRVLRKIALGHFKDRQILMVRDNQNEKIFYFLGGKVEQGETDTECLAREVREELNVDLSLESLKFLKEFQAPAFGKHNAVVNIRLYKGLFKREPETTEEIVEFRYLDSTADPETLTPIANEQIFPWLKEHEYID